MNRMRSKLIKSTTLLLLLFALTSCGFWMLPLRRAKSRDFAIRGAKFSETFDTCVRAAKNINFEIETIDKASGKFSAVRGYGIDEITSLHFHLKEGYRKKLDFTVTVKSSKGASSIIKSYVKSIEKYMDTFPVRSSLDER
jgi:hypothetical protein